MSVKDMIKKSVLESGVFDQYNISSILVALIAALALGILIFLVYRRFYTGVIYSRTFAVTLVGMTVLTCMVTLAISTNVVISLGMVGALSIVRFRTAVKDPMDLLYLFWAITTGITAGAGMYVLALIAAAIMILMIILFFVLYAVFKALARLLSKFFELPVLSLINRVFGGVIGIAEGVILVMLVVSLVRMAMPLTGDSIPFLTQEAIDGSFLFKAFYTGDIINNIAGMFS